MKYFTTAEIAEKWGLTASRVLKLAQGGRIPGAKRIGYRWVIPGNAVKPSDARTKAGKTVHEPDTFRYPSFEYRSLSSFDPPLSTDELILKRVTEQYYACRFEEADKLLGDLPEHAENRYTRLAALYTGCMIDIAQCNPTGFFERYGRLNAELCEEFPHKAEMTEYIHLIEATLGDDSYYMHGFRLKPGYDYHESFLPRLTNLCGVSLNCAGTKLSAAALMYYELNCIFLENSEAYSDQVSAHLYLGIAFGELGDMEKQKFHLRKALTLAEKHEVYFYVAYLYYYMQKLFKPVISEFSEDFRNRMERLSASLHKRYIRFMEAISANGLYKLLPHNGYAFLSFAVQGLTNKEIAGRLHISVGAVGKQYGELYAVLGVENKAELVELYKRSLGEPLLGK